MRKEISFLVIAAIIALGIIIVYYWGGQPTGFFVFEQYENQTACESAGYVWENITEENCTDISNCTVCEEGCVANYTEILCVEGCQETCEENVTCTVCEEGCVANYTEILCEEGCQETCQICEEIVVDAQCVGDICDEDHLDLCLDEDSCEDIGDGYWYDANEDGNSTCNEYECATDSQCDENSECLDGFCEVIEEEQELEQEIPILEEQIPVLIPVLGADNIENIKLNPGASAEISWNVVNNGQVFLTSCSFETSGDYVDWISFAGEGSTDIGIGNTANFDFSVSVPEEIEEGEYALGVTVRCSQVYVSKQFTLQVETKKLEFDLIAADRTRLDRVRIIYSLGELTGEPQDVQLKFVLIGAGTEEITFIEENRSLNANSTKEFRTNMPINESLEGELELVVNYNSEIYSSSVREPIVLGAPIGGAAIFEEIGTGEIAIIVIVLISLVLVLFVVKKIRSSGKTLKTLFQRKKEA